jgi:predicted transcriptional regulator
MEHLGHLQLRVMQNIWRNGPSTVHDVHDALNAQPDAPKQLAYTTVLTVMRSLVKRKFLDQKAEGRAHRFVPIITDEAYAAEMMRQIRVDVFGRDVGKMLACMAGDHGIEAAMRAKIQHLASGA